MLENNLKFEVRTLSYCDIQHKDLIYYLPRKNKYYSIPIIVQIVLTLRDGGSGTVYCIDKYLNLGYTKEK